MKLLELHIQNFGKFSNQSFSFEDGLTIIHGNNEAGKSTLHSFIYAMLFGMTKSEEPFSKQDLYFKYKPWNLETNNTTISPNSVSYGGSMRFEYQGHIYRMDRTFEPNQTEHALHIWDETAKEELLSPQSFLDTLLSGMNPTIYENTISIGQLKSPTDAGIITELKHYIANLNSLSDTNYDVIDTLRLLDNQKKQLESQISFSALSSYTSLKAEIQTLEQEISSLTYENQISFYEQKRDEISARLAKKQEERDALKETCQKKRQALTQYSFTDKQSIQTYLEQVRMGYQKYKLDTTEVTNPSRKRNFSLSVFLFLFFFLIFLYYMALMTGIVPEEKFIFSSTSYLGMITFFSLLASLGSLAVALYLKQLHAYWNRQLNKDTTFLSEVFQLHLGKENIEDGDNFDTLLEQFELHMQELLELCIALEPLEDALCEQDHALSNLEEEYRQYSDQWKEQQVLQQKLDRKLEYLYDCHNHAKVLSYNVCKNTQIQAEIQAITLAEQTIQTLSAQIRESFGFYLNQTASAYLADITGGVYQSISVDNCFHITLYTSERKIPLEQVSRGTIDQVYLALQN